MNILQKIYSIVRPSKNTIETQKILDSPYEYKNYSEEFIRKNKDNPKLVWAYVSKYCKLSEDFIREFKHKLNMKLISIHQNLSEDIIREFLHDFHWSDISRHQGLSESFIIEFQDVLCWDSISSNQKVTKKVLIDFKHKIDWNIAMLYQQLDKEIISSVINSGIVIKQLRNINCIGSNIAVLEQVSGELDSGITIPIEQTLYASYLKSDSNIMRNNYDIFLKQVLPELDWDHISKHVKMSKTFALTYKDFLNWEYVFKYQQHLGLSFFAEHRHYLEMYLSMQNIRREMKNR